MNSNTYLNLITNPILTNVLLPFLLIFVITFASLEKSNALGQNKRNANLIVALIFGLLFVGVQSFVGFTIRLLPLISVFLVVLLSYFLIFGFIGIGTNKGLNITLGIIFGISLIVSVLWATGLLSKIAGKVNAEIIGGIIFFVFLGGAIALVVSTKKSTSETNTNK